MTWFPNFLVRNSFNFYPRNTTEKREKFDMSWFTYQIELKFNYIFLFWQINVRKNDVVRMKMNKNWKKQNNFENFIEKCINERCLYAAHETFLVNNWILCDFVNYIYIRAYIISIIFLGS